MDNKKFDEMMASAVTEVFNKKIDTLLASEESEQAHIFSERHEQRMAELFGQEPPRKWRNFFRKLVRVAAAFVLAAILVSGLLLLNDDVRANTLGRFVRWFNEIAILEFGGSDEGSRYDVWFLTYIPGGFVSQQHDISEYGTHSIYTAEDGGFIIFGAGWMFWLEEGTQVDRGMPLDNVEYTVIEHSGIEYHVFIAFDDTTFPVQIYWEFGGFEFQILSSVDVDTALRMAFSIARE